MLIEAYLFQKSLHCAFRFTLDFQIYNAQHNMHVVPHTHTQYNRPICLALYMDGHIQILRRECTDAREASQFLIIIDIK